MTITNEQLRTIRLECLRMANGDITAARNMVDYITEDSNTDIISDLRTQLAVAESNLEMDSKAVVK